jgi:hypothetical protein
MHGECRPAWACSLPAFCLGYVSTVLADALPGMTSSVAGQASVLSADKTSLFFHCSLLGMVLTHSFQVKSKFG